MKNLFEKVSSLFLVALLLTTMLGSQKAFTRICPITERS